MYVVISTTTTTTTNLKPQKHGAIVVVIRIHLIHVLYISFSAALCSGVFILIDVITKIWKGTEKLPNSAYYEQYECITFTHTLRQREKNKQEKQYINKSVENLCMSFCLMRLSRAIHIKSMHRAQLLRTILQWVSQGDNVPTFLFLLSFTLSLCIPLFFFISNKTWKKRSAYYSPFILHIVCCFNGQRRLYFL